VLAETGQQKGGEQGAFLIGARCKEAGKLLWRYIFTRGVMRSGSDSSRVIPLLPWRLRNWATMTALCRIVLDSKP
jgi:hypothetical protein